MGTYANRARTVETSEITASSLRKSWCTVAHMNDLPSLKLASVARIYLLSIDLWKSDNGSLSQRNNLMITSHLNFWTTESLISESTRSVSESAGLIRKYLEQPAFEGSTTAFVFSNAFLKAFVWLLRKSRCQLWWTSSRTESFMSFNSQLLYTYLRV